MDSFSGQYTKAYLSPKQLESKAPMTFRHFIAYYLENSNYCKKSKICGTKETYCEEYIPFFLGYKDKVMLIIRDIRDIITSLNHGEGEKYSGIPKPHLFNIRTWRKGIAYALNFKKENNLFILRYEDLVKHPNRTFQKIVKFLNISDRAFDYEGQELFDQNGNKWVSNSSFNPTNRISTSSVGRYRDYLSAEEIHFIEACCLPEMKIMKYDVSLDKNNALQHARNFIENESLERSELADYAWDNDRYKEEALRMRMLLDGSYDERTFLFKTAFMKLRQQLIEGK
jgi:hypothetical protein